MNPRCRGSRAARNGSSRWRSARTCCRRGPAVAVSARTPSQSSDVKGTIMAANQDLQYDVFLSHSAKDKAVVRSLAERLRQDGLKVWFDEWVLKPGDSIPAKIEEGLEHSRVLVLCMSANAFGSDWATPVSGRAHLRDPTG